MYSRSLLLIYFMYRGGGLVDKSCPTLAALWTVACQAPLSMEFSKQEYRNELPLPAPGDLPGPGIEPRSLASPASAGGFFTSNAIWEERI